MKITRREWIGSAAALAFAPQFKVLAAPATGPITPERFGAIGDGQTNDTAAFAKMATFVNRQGGGQIVLRATTYVVGQQSPDRRSGYAYAPASIMDFVGCTAPLIIQGNGARLRCADGLRFGTFDPRTGLPTQHSLPYYGTGELASPYFAMIHIQDCSGQIDIEDLELDGNVSGLQIGGPYGDSGWQIPAYGLRLVNNSGSERVARVRSHHHALDGVLIDGLVDRQTASAFEELTSEYNARQGCTIVGGCNYSFVNSQFNHTGRAGLVSAPGAGVDIEAEGGKTVRNLTFTGCEFSNNTGAGLCADSGDSEGVTFDQCRFIGTTSWAAWPRKPRYRFLNSAFVGSICNTFGDPDPERAAQFHDCSFGDDPALSPTGVAYTAYPIADLSDYRNVLFNRCRFDLTRDGVLPWSVFALYNDCTMSQLASKQSYPRGTYTGVNRIDGNVGLEGSIILGDLTVNGTLVPRTG